MYLTLVGGGVFDNKLEWIVDAVNQAVREIADRGLEIHLQVFVVLVMKISGNLLKKNLNFIINRLLCSFYYKTLNHKTDKIIKMIKIIKLHCLSTYN